MTAWGRVVVLAAVAAPVVLALAGAAIAVVPTNDNFAAAETISGATGSVTGTTVDATNESGDAVVRDVWYQWTAPADGEQLFVLNVPHTPFLAGFRVGLINTPGEALATPHFQVDCTIYGLENANRICVRRPVENGVTYKLWVHAIAPDGSFLPPGTAFNIQWRPMPTNDHFADAETISGATGSVTGTTVDATNESGDAVVRDVWYQWTAPADGEQLFVLNVPHTPFLAGFRVGLINTPGEALATPHFQVDCTIYGLENANRICVRRPVENGVTYKLWVQR